MRNDQTLTARRAEPADAELVTTIITLSFACDPLWSHALKTESGRSDHHQEHWSLLVGGALRHTWTWLAEGGGATSIWIPPGGTEMSPEQEEQLDKLVDEHLGASAADYRELVARFNAAHPRGTPHYYLSLLGTHPEHRGRRLGMRLLAHDLELIDAERLPAYLESSNPANNHRYASVGFEPIAEFSYPGNGPLVTTMWRPAR